MRQVATGTKLSDTCSGFFKPVISALSSRLRPAVRRVASTPMKVRLWLLALSAAMMITACRSTYYAAWEKFGVYKRDLLKRKVEAARDDQKAAGEQFKDALTRLKEMYGFSGGALEKNYNGLQKDYDKSVARADTVHKRIKDVETVAEDLFSEWEKELQQISSSSLRSDSKAKLRETRGRYDDMHA